MQYFVSFLEGIITFISPCLLPMLPVYLSYFAGGGERSARRTLANAFGFVCGFTAVFVAMGALSGTLGSFFVRWRTALDIVCGAVVIIFGLHFLGVIRLNLFGGGRRAGSREMGFFSAALFGVVFSVSWTPCVGAFLGSALMLASREGSALTGMTMLLCYSAGLGIPFLISAVLIDRLRGAFDGIKKHYRVVSIVCGAFLIAVGVLMATGLFGRLLTLLA